MDTKRMGMASLLAGPAHLDFFLWRIIYSEQQLKGDKLSFLSNHSYCEGLHHDRDNQTARTRIAPQYQGLQSGLLRA